MEKKHKLTKRIGLSVIRIVLLSYLGLMAFLFFFQSHFIYRPSKEIIVTPAALRLKYENVSLVTADHYKLDGWFVPAENPKGTVLFCHSNAGNMSNYIDAVEVFNELGFNILLFDYRGYGLSEGKPTEQGTYLDAEAAWEFLVQSKKTDPLEIIIVGRSLGAAVAVLLAGRHTPSLLIIESAFTSFPDIAAVHFPYLPARILARYKYDVIDLLQKVECPILVVHSRDDEIVPFEHGRKIFNSLKGKKEFLAISGPHNEGFVESRKKYINGLKNFISEYYQKQNP